MANAGPRPTYQNPDAVEGTIRKSQTELKPWEPGAEIVFFNSRNIYTDGGRWKYVSQNGIEWVKEPPSGDFRAHRQNMVMRTAKPRLLWVGSSRGWGLSNGEVRAGELMVHSGDVYPSGSETRRGFLTARIGEAFLLWEAGRLAGVSWSGSKLDVRFSGEPGDEELLSIGWKRMDGGEIIDIDTPLGPEIIESSLVLAGHDASLWVGLGKITIGHSGREGCIPSSFVVTDPKLAGKHLPGLSKVPKGCKVVVERPGRLGFSYLRAFESSFVTGDKIAFHLGHLPPLKKGTERAELKSRGAGKYFLVVTVSDINFSKPFRPVVGIYTGKNEEEPCFVTGNPAAMVYSSSAARKRLTWASTAKSYRVVAPFPNGKKISSQKMFGRRAITRLPENLPGELERLRGIYGDVVPDNYYEFTEREYKSRAEAKAKLISQGYARWDEAAGKSAVPPGVLHLLKTKGLVPSATAYPGAEYYRPLRSEDVGSNPDIVRALIEHACEEEWAWLCQLVAQFPSSFKKGLFTAALA